MNAPRGGGGGGGGKGKGKGGSGGGGGNKSNRSGGRPRRNRGKASRNKGPRSNNARRGPPQSPQTKVCFRNISNTDVFGTVEAIAKGILVPIVSAANERLEANKICLDEASLYKLVEGDTLATQAREDWKKRHEGGGDSAKTAEQSDEAMPSEEKAEAESSSTDAIVTDMKDLNINDSNVGGSSVFARPLYVVPPKKTRRRGEKPGNAYLMLTTPPIPAVQTAPRPVEETRTPSEDGSQTTAEVPSLPVIRVDYSRQMAERQLALVRAVEAMTAIAAQDTSGQWAGCIVEEAKNAKSWRPPQRKDHRDGTVEQSPGFKAFLEMTAKEKEDLQSRPKPAPGGGVASLTSGLAGTTENGKPVAALVLHLQKKREHEKVQKKKKRKAKDAQKKSASTGDTNAATTNGKSDPKKRGRQRKNKRNVASKKAEAKP